MGRIKENQLVKINDKFRKRIRNYLISNSYLTYEGLPLKEFAEFCDVSLSTVKKILYSKVRKDRDIFSMFIIDKICCYLGENFLSLYDEIEFLDKK